MNTGRGMARVPERENGPITLLEEKVWSVKSESRVADKKGLSDSQDGNDDQDQCPAFRRPSRERKISRWC